MRLLRLLVAALVAFSAGSAAQAKGKLAGNAGGGEREVAAYSPAKGLEGWTITDPSGEFEFPLDPGDYVVSCGGRLAPYVHIEEGQTTYISHSDDPSFDLPREMWTPACKSFGQTYVATGFALSGVWFWMPQGTSAMKVTLREGGPDGKLVGESVSEGKCDWITGVGVPPERFPTTPGKTYYLEIASTEDVSWTIAMPKEPDPYDGGIAYFDGVPHPESDLGVSIGEKLPGPVTVAAAGADQHYIDKGPGSGWCTVAGQSFVARNGSNILSASANCGFGGGATDFIYTIREGGAQGKALCSKTVRMVSDWGASAYFEPDEVLLKTGEPYYLEYKRADGDKFYSYLSADLCPDGKAYRDGKEVEGFDQLFDIVGEVEPGGISYPYNVKLTGVTSASARFSWETGTPADGIIHFGDRLPVRQSIVVHDDVRKQHSIELTGLRPATVYYYRATSFTRKKGASRAWSRVQSFLTLPSDRDGPLYEKPQPVPPPPVDGPKSVKVANGSFEDGLTGWQRCSAANPKESKDYPFGNGPFGDATAGTDGYRPHFGKMLYGWYHLAEEDPNPTVPREDWKQEIISQRVKVKPGHDYVLKAWLLTGDRDSGWGRDGRIRLVVDAKDSGALDEIDAKSHTVATQWFATEHEWKPVSLRFTAEKDTAAIGVHFLQWWALEADYLYVDDVTLEEIR